MLHLRLFILTLSLVIYTSAFSGCANLDNGRLFPNAPNGSFINTPALGPGPTGPSGPSAGNTFNTPSGP